MEYAEIDRFEEEPVTVAQIRWWYGRYNKLYFRGMLPKPLKIVFRRKLIFGGTECVAAVECLPGNSGRKGRNSFAVDTIWFNSRIRPWVMNDELKVALLHEMIHVRLRQLGRKHNCTKVRREKNDAFLKEQRRLMKAGAYDRLL